MAAESIQVATYRVRTSAWKETAEKPAAAKILDDTSGSYSLMPTMSSFAGFGTVSGPKAFTLTFPSAYDLISRGVPEQSFELDRNIVAKSKATNCW